MMGVIWGFWCTWAYPWCYIGVLAYLGPWCYMGVLVYLGISLANNNAGIECRTV